MDAARPLRDVFADLAQDEGAPTAQDVLRASGHTDLPDGLVAEAVGTYADTAPIEVAEHLSPYVMAHSPVPLPDVPEVDASGWLNAVVSAPVPDLDVDALSSLDEPGPVTAPPGDSVDDLDDPPAFGHGQTPDDSTGSVDDTGYDDDTSFDDSAPADTWYASTVDEAIEEDQTDVDSGYGPDLAETGAPPTLDHDLDRDPDQDLDLS